MTVQKIKKTFLIEINIEYRLIELIKRKKNRKTKKEKSIIIKKNNLEKIIQEF